MDLIPVEKCTWKYLRASGQKRKTMQAVLAFFKKTIKTQTTFTFVIQGVGIILFDFTLNYGNKNNF